MFKLVAAVLGGPEAFDHYNHGAQTEQEMLSHNSYNFLVVGSEKTTLYF